MIEQDEIDRNDPEIQENIRAVQHAVSIFMDVARWSPSEWRPREEDKDDIVNELYAKDGDIYDPVAWTLAWQRVRTRRKEAALREAKLIAKEEARRQEIEDFKRPSSHDLPALQAEMRSRLTPAPRQAGPPREYTDTEMSAMSGDEYRRLVLGGVSIDDRQGTTGHSYKPVIRPSNKNSSKPTLRNLKRRLENL
jgi:hypothetical protein